MSSIVLPRPVAPVSGTLAATLSARRTTRHFEPEPVTLAAVSELLWSGQGITGDRGQRAAPSAGALYPLTLFALIRKVSGTDPGLYRYHPLDHRLEAVTGHLPGPLGEAALEDQPWLDLAPLVIIIAGDFARAGDHFAHQPPEGERGARYTYIETGAVAQNIHLQATSLGLGQVLVAGFDDAAMGDRLQLPDGLKPTALLCLGRPA